MNKILIIILGIFSWTLSAQYIDTIKPIDIIKYLF